MKIDDIWCFWRKYNCFCWIVLVFYWLELHGKSDRNLKELMVLWKDHTRYIQWSWNTMVLKYIYSPKFSKNRLVRLTLWSILEVFDNIIFLCDYPGWIQPLPTCIVCLQLHMIQFPYNAKALMKSTNSHIQVYCNNNLLQGKLTLKTYRKHTLVEAMVENLSISNTYGRCRVSKL